jgi:hypothetical protein
MFVDKFAFTNIFVVYLSHEFKKGIDHPFFYD